MNETSRELKVRELLSGKTIEKIEFDSWQAPCDTLFLYFTDKTHIKIMSDPECCFDGLKFYIQKTEVVQKTVEVKNDEEIT